MSVPSSEAPPDPSSQAAGLQWLPRAYAGLGRPTGRRTPYSEAGATAGLTATVGLKVLPEPQDTPKTSLGLPGPPRFSAMAAVAPGLHRPLAAAHPTAQSLEAEGSACFRT